MATLDAGVLDDHGFRSKWHPDASDIARYWKLGTIKRVYPGKDDMVRVVDVKERNKVYGPSIGRISPLEFRTTNKTNRS